jgi:multidrug efflux pump subunit AcrB
MKQDTGLGISGHLARMFITSPLTPLFLLAGLALGLLALMALPREEEPQISVPMVDIFVRADGLKAEDAAKLITEPLETIVKAIRDVEHVYSNTMDDRVVVTARFLVGTSPDDAILRVHERIRANFDKIPTGIPEPLIIGRGIDDVAIVTLTLAPKPGAQHTDNGALYRVAENVQVEIAKLEDVGLSYVVGGDEPQIRVEPDPERLSLYGVTLSQLLAKVQAANQASQAGVVRDGGRSVLVAAGQTLSGVPDIGLLVLSTRDGRPVYVRDVASIVVGTKPSEHRVWTLRKSESGDLQRAPAITLAFAKRSGANAVVISERIIHRVEALKGSMIPANFDVEVTRNYGETANEKANELLFHLGLATISIVALVGFAIGWREGIVVAIVIPVTILLTLFASWLMGYTINRVSLFALIFSIGILVDDAIVIIENIARHWAMRDERSRVQAAIDAVAEVGNPTIVATLTVVAALLPMLFVSGLMGPYMSPIPANASAAMLLSFFVAVVITPWLMLRFAKPGAAHHDGHEDSSWIARGYRAVAEPLLASKTRSWLFLIAVGIATLASITLIATKAVTVKLLPFDDKSELQAVLDMPSGTSLEDTDRALARLAGQLQDLPELASIQSYAGTSAPFNFNGLVRHSYLRSEAYQGDLQINLQPKHDRTRPSHAIALDVRKRLQDVPLPAGSVLKVVEVPPGPPVIATLLAEVYGDDPEQRRAIANEIRALFKSVPFVVDDDITNRDRAPRVRFVIDQDKLEYHKVEERDVYDAIRTYLGGTPVGYSHKGGGRHPVEIAVQLPKSGLAITQQTLSTPVPANTIPGARNVVELGDVIKIVHEEASWPIFRHNGRAAEMVMAELAGSFEAPIYGILAINELIEQKDWGSLPKPEISFHGQPDDATKPVLLWDGEWEVTYVTFRDMGAAFGVALIGIYVLVVAQFGSFLLPLVILTPVPLTLIGIMIGHWLFGAPFSATSMIGFIALAGIIVRNSILLVDFIRERRRTNASLHDVLIEAGSIRFKPILLTALAAMIGAAVILADPIFQGLAISLLFGLASSTLLTILVIPAIYLVLRGDKLPATKPPAA